MAASPQTPIRRGIAPVTLIALVALGMACSKGRDEFNGKLYRNYQYAFSLKVPSGWSVVNALHAAMKANPQTKVDTLDEKAWTEAVAKMNFVAMISDRPYGMGDQFLTNVAINVRELYPDERMKDAMALAQLELNQVPKTMQNFVVTVPPQRVKRVPYDAVEWEHEFTYTSAQGPTRVHMWVRKVKYQNRCYTVIAADLADRYERARGSFDGILKSLKLG